MAAQAQRKKSNGEKSPKKKSKPTAKTHKKAPAVPMAEQADRHDLYERAVQDCASEVEFLLAAYAEVYGRKERPLHLREDFCGTAALCAEWVKGGSQRTASGFDIDPDCLQWGRVRNLAPLGRAASRVTLHEKDVRAHDEQLADLRVAHNFSYQVFQERAELLEYFRAARAGMSEQGIFVIDLFGGSEAHLELTEEREIEDGAFTYVWDQHRFHPASGHMDCFIHFEFPDGSRMREAFAYSWRLYTPPELRDILLEAGFADVWTYFEGYDEDGDGTGEFERDEKGPACEGWLGYMVAIPS